MWYNSAANLLRHYTVRLMGERDPQTGKIQIVHVYSWEIINDQKALDAYAAASQAQDTADGKRTVLLRNQRHPILMMSVICGLTAFTIPTVLFITMTFAMCDRQGQGRGVFNHALGVGHGV